MELDATPLEVATVMVAVPDEAINPAETEALTWVELLKAVGRGAPFQCTLTDGSKLEPVTMRVNPGPPATAEVGLRLLTVGAAPMTLNWSELELPPPGYDTATRTWPAEAIRLAGTVAVSWVAPK